MCAIRKFELDDFLKAVEKETGCLFDRNSVAEEVSQAAEEHRAAELYSEPIELKDRMLFFLFQRLRIRVRVFKNDDKISSAEVRAKYDHRDGGGSNGCSLFYLEPKNGSLLRVHYENDKELGYKKIVKVVG